MCQNSSFKYQFVEKIIAMSQDVSSPAPQGGTRSQGRATAHLGAGTMKIIKKCFSAPVMVVLKMMVLEAEKQGYAISSSCTSPSSCFVFLIPLFPSPV